MEETNKKSVNDIINEYKKTVNQGNDVKKEKPQTEETAPPKNSNQEIKDVYNSVGKETDPDLMISYETISLPSNDLNYYNTIKEVDVEYMTSKDEDLLTTPSLIEKGTAINKLLKRKIKTPGVDLNNLLPGDKSAIILFLRTSSYGPEYTVEVQDPRTGDYFKEKVDLFKLKPKEIIEQPDENGLFNVELPMRKKLVKFRLLTSGEEEQIRKNAEAMKEQYNEDYVQYSTLRLKASIVSIDGNGDRNYINKFVDAMPGWDSLTIKRKINKVSPEYDMNYEFTASDGYKFKAYLMVGSDFFFPNE